MEGEVCRQSAEIRFGTWPQERAALTGYPSESFFHTLKVEWVDDQQYVTREQARQSIFEYIEVFYNRQRKHSTIDYMTPLQQMSCFAKQHENMSRKVLPDQKIPDRGIEEGRNFASQDCAIIGEITHGREIMRTCSGFP